MIVKPYRQIEDGIFLIINQDKTETFFVAKKHTLENICVVIEAFLAEAKLGLTFYEIR